MGESLGDAVLKLRADSGPLMREMDRAQTLAMARWQKTGRAMTAAGRKLTRTVTLPLLGIGVAAAKMGMDFEQNMRLISTQAGASSQEVKNLRGEVLELAKASEFSPTELAKGLFRIESAGLRGKKAMDVLRTATKGAEVGQADFEAVSTALTAAVKTGIKGTEDYTQAMATLSAIVGSGNMRMEDLAAALSTGILPSAKAFGLSLRDVGTALAVMTARGTPAQAAATRLRMTFSKMGTQTDAAKKAFAEIGIEEFQLAKLMRSKGLIPALELLSTKLKGSGKTAEEQTDLISRAFGGGRTSAGILTLLQNMDSLRKTYKSTGTTAEEFNKKHREQQQETAARLKRAWSSVQVALVKLGAALAPVAVSLGNMMSGFADWFDSLSDGQRKTVIIMAAVAAAVGPVLSIVGRLVLAWNAVAAAAGRAAVAQRGAAVTGADAGTASVVGSGITAGRFKGLMLGGLRLAKGAGIVGAIAWATGDILTMALSKGSLWERAKKTFTAKLVGAVGGIFKGTSLEGEMREFGKGVKRFIAGKDFKSFVDAMKDLGNAMKDLGKVARQVFENVLLPVIKNVLLPTLRMLAPAFVQVFGGLARILSGHVKVIAGILTLDFKQAWDGVKDIFRGSLNALVGHLRAATAPIRAMAQAIGKAIKSAFQSAFDFVVDKTLWMLQKIMWGFEKLAGVVSKMSWLPGFGGKFKDLRDEIKDASTAIDEWRDKLKEANRDAKSTHEKTKTKTLPVAADISAARTTEALNRQSRALKRVSKGEAEVEAARKRARNASDSVRRAETNLRAVRRAFGTDSREYRAAEDRLARARSKQATENKRVGRSENNLAREIHKSSDASKGAERTTKSRVTQLREKVSKLRAAETAERRERGNTDVAKNLAKRRTKAEKDLNTAVEGRKKAGKRAETADKKMRESGFQTAKTWATVIGFYVLGLNKVLQAVGAKKLNITPKGIGKAIGTFAGVLGMQRGGVLVPGSGSGDKVPALLEPGEVVWNRELVQAWGGPQVVDAPNRLVRRFQHGGMVDPDWDPGGQVLNKSISAAVGRWAKTYGADMTAGYDPGGSHVSPGHNVTGTATDMVPRGGWSTRGTRRFEQGLRVLTSKGIKVLYGTDGIGIAYPDHGRGNHAHIEWGLAPPGAVDTDMLPRVTFSGQDGAIKDLLQAGADRVRKAANVYITKQMGGFAEGAEAGISGPGKIVGATTFGGSGDPRTGSVGYKGDSLIGKMAYAELGMGRALGGLPYRKALGISSAGRSVTARKLDIGAGGGAIQGHPRAIDLWHETAQAIGLPSVWSGLVKVAGLQRGGIVQRFARGGTVRPKKRKSGKHRGKKIRGATHGSTLTVPAFLDAPFSHHMPEGRIQRAGALASEIEVKGVDLENLKREIDRTDEEYLVQAGPDAVDAQGRRITEYLNIEGMTDPVTGKWVRGVNDAVGEFNAQIQANVGVLNLLSERMATVQAIRAKLGEGIAERNARIAEIRKIVKANRAAIRRHLRNRKKWIRKRNKARSDLDKEKKKKNPSQSHIKSLQKKLNTYQGKVDWHSERIRAYRESNKELTGESEGNLESPDEKSPLGRAAKSRDAWREKDTEYEPMVAPTVGDIPKEITEAVWNITDLRDLIAEATGTRPAPPEEAEAAAESDQAERKAELLQGLLEKAQKETAMLKAQLPVFQKFFPPFGGSFHQGGIVPGPVGAERTVIAQGGERFTPPGAEDNLYVTVLVKDGAVNSDAIDVRVDRKLSDVVRRASAGGPATGRKKVFRA